MEATVPSIPIFQQARRLSPPLGKADHHRDPHAPMKQKLSHVILFVVLVIGLLNSADAVTLPVVANTGIAQQWDYATSNGIWGLDPYLIVNHFFLFAGVTPPPIEEPYWIMYAWIDTDGLATGFHDAGYLDNMEPVWVLAY